jgi:tripartite-type tricarboxylate transporter receptor subunit TctC
MARHLMAAAVLLMAAGIAGAQAEDYSARTVTIIVPFAAGGPADITGRIVADIFNHHLGQKFVVENAGGAGGTLRAARAAARIYDPVRSPRHLAPAFYPDLGYDPQRISSRSD